MKTVLNVKVDKEVKQKAQKVAAELGLPLSIVVNANLQRFIEDRRIVFAVPRKMSKKLERRLGKIVADVEAGQNLSPAFVSMKEAIKYLHA
ncbi:MAG: hypothetical protein A2836_03910 [Candidatus Taylorbacteria bacterium RIFCSPHIGHO2_01_FULL_45_63]|uniref:Uncharacterized protein n=1 Tax=Candidatus Taylorbacteria bacterium RIFCSPHIGHO2_02_FULL_45_35 TaxID=1802311 RepID=A0A1G2MPH4_9BACT|nr:MAG: hypothetical protein A2836_03910 [Candidatus Taylorbacteria bacterium RIFCSPHIGHO2_01_FULL_45_63]OHA25797.1 MAG: hypothetical protein A3D56_00890 [Candidatus Taylorbacteria bacterium RIFCSPHIGHO2_02_FULL_45_35]OHA34370.1 MAG: hypothetical protein A3A22_00610 [Candidatus Taylorbacteria bacterium RIFCSPLOWO2_01_FULL_45_34b]